LFQGKKKYTKLVFYEIEREFFLKNIHKLKNFKFIKTASFFRKKTYYRFKFLTQTYNRNHQTTC